MFTNLPLISFSSTVRGQFALINTSIVRPCTKFSAAYDSLKVGHNFNFFAESMYNLQFHLLFNLFNFIRLPSSFDFLNTSSVSSY